MSVSYRYLDLSKTLKELETFKTSIINLESLLKREDFHLRPFTDRGVTDSELRSIRDNLFELAGVVDTKGLSRVLAPIEFDQFFVRNCAHIFESLELVDAFQSQVWSYLTIRVLPDFALWRWPNNAPERYFGNPERNAFQRLWHRGFILGPELGSELQEDEAIKIFERMEAFGSDGCIASPFAQKIVDYRKSRSKGDPGSSEVAAQVAVRLRYPQFVEFRDLRLCGSAFQFGLVISQEAVTA